MVYFTCGTCGEQIKKPQVEKHYTQKCRNCTMLTCIDCLKDFYGDEYKAHNQCMSESQRYSKEGREGWDPAVGQGNKGERKQQLWIGKLRQLLETTEDVEPAVRNIVNTILNHENIPRKRPKFLNFVKNIMRNKTRVDDIEKTWDLFSLALQPAKEETKSEDSSMNEDSQGGVEEPTEQVKEEPKDTGEKKMSKKEKKKKKKNQPEPEPEPEPVPVKTKKKKKKKNKENEETEMETEPVKKKGEKRKLEESMEVDQVESCEPAVKKAKFDWDQTITAILSKKGEEMKLTKLKKKCVAEFLAQNSGTHLSEAEIGAKFDKKIKKKAYRVLKDKVRLSNPDVKEDENEESEQANGGSEQTNGGTEKVNGSEKLSFNQWEATSLGNDAQTEKFRRLMGIKTSKPPQVLGTGTQRDDRKMFRELEDGFEKARTTHFKAKGKGLGFS